jgi:UDP-N-acetylmuramoylalanine--D-glutamate ligase
VREYGGADWYNDSIATAPERTIAALESFDRPIILLAGGRDKNLPWDKLATLIREKVDHLILFGEAAELIHEAVGEANPFLRPQTIDHCKGLKEAVQKAAERVEKGYVVLLSPGGTSFDEFTDFEERGRRFRQWVKELS